MANFVASKVGSNGWLMVHDLDDKTAQASAVFAPHLVLEAEELASRLNIRAMAAEVVQAAKGGN